MPRQHARARPITPKTADALCSHLIGELHAARVRQDPALFPQHFADLRADILDLAQHGSSAATWRRWLHWLDRLDTDPLARELWTTRSR